MYWQISGLSLAFTIRDRGALSCIRHRQGNSNMNDSHQQSAAAKRADRHFRKEQEETEKVVAWTEYRASQAATLAKTVRLKALRLARDAAVPKVSPKAARATRKSASRPSSR
jgi:hypothetical protein